MFRSSVMPRLLTAFCLLATTLLLPAAARAQAPAADPSPEASTAPAEAVQRHSATLRGSVDPNGAPAEYRFEYGRTTDYGHLTPVTSAFSGEDPVDVAEPVDGLSGNTLYHYRILAFPEGEADNDSAIVAGDDVTFHTPGVPGAHTDSVLETRVDGATVQGTVTPRSAPTTYWFEYGQTRTYGLSTPHRSAGGGTGSLRVSAVLGGLQPHTTYHFRLVAQNAAGIKHGPDRRFKTLRRPTGIVVTRPVRRLRFGKVTRVEGTVSGAAVGGVRVALEAQPFPFTAPFLQQGPSVPTRADGSFTLISPPLWVSTRLRVVTRTVLEAASAPVVAFARVVVGIDKRRRHHGRFRIEGNVTPHVRHAKVSLQRRGRHGGWHFVKRNHTRRIGRGRFGYRFTVARKRRPQHYRAIVTPRTLAHARGTSHTVRVPARHRHHRHHRR